MSRRLSFGYSGDAISTFKSWAPKLRDVVGRLIALEEDIITDKQTLTRKRLFNKPVYRKFVDLGNLPNATTKTVLHGLSRFERLWIAEGSATNGSQTVPLPYIDTTSANCIEIRMSATEVTIVTGFNFSAYRGWIVLEYTEQ